MKLLYLGPLRIEGYWGISWDHIENSPSLRTLGTRSLKQPYTKSLEVVN